MAPTIILASDTCPCCGHSIDSPSLKVSLDFNTLISGNTALEVPPKICEFIFALQKAWPHTLPFSRANHAVWGHEGGAEGSLRNLAYSARKILNTLGYTVRASIKRGYRLERLPKEKA